MPNAGGGRGRKRKTIPNVSQRAGGSAPSKRPSTLPQQYNFTPAAVQVPPTQSPEAPQANLQGQPTTAPHFRNYPPPVQLFQNSTNQQREVDPPARSEEVQFNPPTQPNLQEEDPNSPNQNFQAHSHPSSQGNNFQEEYPPVLPELQEDTLRSLNALLAVPDRELVTTVLSFKPRPNTKWYETNSVVVFCSIYLLFSALDLMFIVF